MRDIVIRIEQTIHLEDRDKYGDKSLSFLTEEIARIHTLYYCNEAIDWTQAALTICEKENIVSPCVEVLTSVASELLTKALQTGAVALLEQQILS
jgi:hypothetical protein